MEISPLSGMSLNNCIIEFDVYLSSATVDLGFGFDVTNGGTNRAFVGLNDYRRFTYRNWTSTSDSYYNVNDNSLTGWLHFKYTIANDLLLLELYKEDTLKYSRSASLPSSNIGTSTVYRLSPFWKASERKFKNLIVREI